MIIAGTVSAYLKLSIDDFQNNLQSAIRLLGQVPLAVAPVNAGLRGLELTSGYTSASLKGMPFGAVCAGLHGMELAAGSASGSFKTMQSGITTALSSVQHTAAATCTGMTATMSATAQDIKSGVLAPIRSLPVPLSAAMKEAGNGMAAGLRSKTSYIVSVARSIASQVTSTIRSALKIASPSKVMRQIGAYTVEGMALGLADGIPRVADSSAAVARTVERCSTPALSLAGSNVYSAGGTISVKTESSAELAALSERMDRLLDYLYDTEPVLRLDGRTFGRMVREYS